MAKYLRHIAVYPEPAVLAVLRNETDHLCWMYEHYVTPYPTGGVTKVNVWFTPDLNNAEPNECLGIADVRVHFDIACYPLLPDAERPRYYLDRLHTGIVCCAQRFGWNPAALEAARAQMPNDGRPFTIPVGKPVNGPGRRIRAQGVIEAGPQTRIWLVFTDREGTDTGRALLSATRAGSCDPRFYFGKLAWLDDRTVRVTQGNGRDFWLCTTDGLVEFHYPRAAAGNPDGEFALGKMYYEGTVVLEDRERGLGLLCSAAAKGDKHARAFLSRLERTAQFIEPGAPAPRQ